MNEITNYLTWSNKKALFTVVDVETTGISARFNHIIEIGIVSFCGDEILNRYQTYINPGMELPFFITELTGITDRDLADAPSFGEVAQEIYALLENSVIVGHNLSFDIQFLKTEFFRVGITDFAPLEVCTLRLSRRLYPELKSKALAKVASHLKLKIKNEHRAYDDAELTLKIFRKQLLALEELKIKTVKQLYTFQFTPVKSIQKTDFAEESSSTFADIPTSPGVYIFMDGKGKVIYIGKAKSLKQRLQSHFSNSAPRKSKSIVDRAKKLQLYVTRTELVAFLLEAELIKIFLPKSNVQLKRYTNSFFLKVDKETAFPSISITNKFFYDNNDYFGLFISRPKAQETFSLIQKTFRLRECDDKEFNKGKRCFLAEIERCTVPCENGDEESYHKELTAIYDFLFGKQQTALDRLLRRMKSYSDSLKFEKAAEVKELVDMVLKQVHKSSLLAEPVNRSNVLIRIAGDRGHFDHILLTEGRAFIKDYPVDDRNSFEQAIDDYYNGLIQSSMQPEKEDLEKMKIILNWVIKHRNNCEFYYLKNYRDKSHLFSSVPGRSAQFSEKIINLDVESLLR
jgi:DNA polymerase-3 subunit epsilon